MWVDIGITGLLTCLFALGRVNPHSATSPHSVICRGGMLHSSRKISMVSEGTTRRVSESSEGRDVIAAGYVQR